MRAEGKTLESCLSSCCWDRRRPRLLSSILVQFGFDA